MVDSEQARLRALHDLALLDTPPEERFDRYTRLATHLFGVEIALVSLVDEERQWFKSQQGLSLNQTSRQESFCSHAIQEAEIFEIEDASQDARFASNRLVTARRGIRFYAGAPLTTADGFRVGTLCIIDSSPRRLTFNEKQSLKDLAASVEDEINRSALAVEFAKADQARHYLELEEQQQRELVAVLASLNEISALSELTLNEQLHQALALGASFLALEIGIISRIEKGLYEVVASFSPEDMPLERGHSLPLADTYCSMMLESNDLLAIHHIAQHEARHHPCYQKFELEAYIGITIKISNQLFGSVSFSSPKPLIAPFSQTDKLFIRLLSRWLAACLERQRVEKLKNEFIATVSHELRTPLTTINGVLKLAVSGTTGVLPSKTEQLLGIALKNSQRLGILINDLLDMEKLVLGQFDFFISKHSVDSLLLNAVKENQSYADQYQVDLILREPVSRRKIAVDSVRFQQIMANLLSNAAKFSYPGGQVEVYCEEHEAYVCICVCDYGDGIPENFRSRIFEKFSQADASDRRIKGGTGLGLSISKSLTGHMGGEIGFRSCEGEGSTFHIMFPWVEEKTSAKY